MYQVSSSRDYYSNRLSVATSLRPSCAISLAPATVQNWQSKATQSVIFIEKRVHVHVYLNIGVMLALVMQVMLVMQVILVMLVMQVMQIMLVMLGNGGNEGNAGNAGNAW